MHPSSADGLSRGKSHLIVSGSPSTIWINSRSVRSSSLCRISRGAGSAIFCCPGRPPPSAAGRCELTPHPVQASSGTRSRCDNVSSTLALFTSSRADASPGFGSSDPGSIQRPAASPRRLEVETHGRSSEQVGKRVRRLLNQCAKRSAPFVKKIVTWVKIRRQRENSQIQVASREKLSARSAARCPAASAS